MNTRRAIIGLYRVGRILWGSPKKELAGIRAPLRPRCTDARSMVAIWRKSLAWLYQRDGTMDSQRALIVGAVLAGSTLVAVPAPAQLIDRTQAPNVANAGIAKSLPEQIGADRGDIMTPDSSIFIINRDPARSIRRGRQLFQRKFTAAQGQGPSVGDGRGDINTILAIGAGLSDSCAECHGRPRGSAGFGGNVVTRPDSRDAPHLFGLGLKEMLADEITADLRAIQDRAIAEARASGRSVTRPLTSKGTHSSKAIHYGSITARPDGSVDASRIEGVDPDLRVRPFFLHGGTISIREFIVGALQTRWGFRRLTPISRQHVPGAAL